MKKCALILILLLVTTETPAKEIDELHHMASIVTNNNQTIDSWTVTIKEKVPYNKGYKAINILKKKHLINSTKNINSTKYFFQDTHNLGGISVSYYVVIPKDKNQLTSITAVIEGSVWEESTFKDYQKVVKKITSNFFTKKSNKFTCLTTTSNAIIESNGLLDSIIRELDLNYVSAQSDTVGSSTHKKIVYGYTQVWSTKIMLLDKPLNVQIVTESTGIDKQRIIIGTPILINEY